MQRIKINLPNSFSFSTELPIRITEVNYGGHVGNNSFLSLIHEARMQYLAYYGYTELNFDGAGLIMADVAVEFKQELHYGDTVKISVQAADFDKIGFDIFYLLEKISPTGLLIAGKAKTGMMCFDYNEKKKKTISVATIQLLQGNI